jgi:Ca-activated chloride channel homolog
MDWRYSKFDPALSGLKELLERLLSIFNQLLLQTDGDVDEALDILEALDRRYRIFQGRLTLEDFKKFLERERTIARAPGGRHTLTRKGERGLRASAFDTIFATLERDLEGEHRVDALGPGNERLADTRPFEFGDPVHAIEPTQSIANAIRRGGPDAITLGEADLAIHETENASSCATVLMVDVSHSMVLYGEDRITPAKRVALALCELITTRYPKDSLDVVLFGDTAWQVSTAELPYVSVGPYHTNTRAGLELARGILRRTRKHNRQIIMLTDGKPSALTERGGAIYKNPFGLDRRIVNKTLEEAEACRRHGIPITTFMLTTDPTLVEFVERFTRVNRGRAYYSQLDRLGSFVLVDYVRNRKRRVR